MVIYAFLERFKSDNQREEMHEEWNAMKCNEMKKKPQFSSKTPKPRFQNMKCMKNERLEAY